MTVYVDDAKKKFGRMIMCHMVADSIDELHDMADKLGLKRSWYHRGHYNICQLYKDRALSLGALAISKREATKIRKIIS